MSTIDSASEWHLGSKMSNDRKFSIERYGTTMNPIFTRYLNKFQSKIFISYFCYHKPTVSFLEYDNNTNSKNASILKIYNNDNNVTTQVDLNNV